MHRSFLTFASCALAAGLLAAPAYAAPATPESAAPETVATTESAAPETTAPEPDDIANAIAPLAETPPEGPETITDGRFKAGRNGDGVYLLNGLADGVSLESVLDGTTLRLPETIEGYTIIAVAPDAFANVNGEAVTAVVIPDCYIRLNDRALAGLTNIEQVEFGGTQAQWDALLREGTADEVWLGAGNEFLRCVTAVCADGTLERSHDWQQSADGMTVCSRCGAVDAEPITDGLFTAAYQDGQWTLIGLVDGHTLNEAVTDDAKVLVLPDEIDGHAITVIGNRAFSGNYTYDDVLVCKSVDFPDGLTRIGQEAFMTSSTPRHTIVNLDIPDTVTEIGQRAFAYDWISTVELPENEAYTAIEAGMFTGCYFMTDITIPVNVTEIQNNAFDYCSVLEAVHYQGNQAQWNNVNVSYGNDMCQRLLTAGKQDGVNLPGCVDIVCTDGTVSGDHNWEVLEVVEEPTCAVSGYERIYCDKCEMETTHNLPATGAHTFGEPVIFQLPTTKAEGKQTVTCTVCGYTETQTIPRLTAPATPAATPTTVTNTSEDTPAEEAPATPAPSAVPTANPAPANTIPQTGDFFPLGLVGALLVGSGVAIALLVRRRIG